MYQNSKVHYQKRNSHSYSKSSPKITDEPEVWVDFLTGLKDQLNTEGAGQIPQADPSAPASQSLLDEIERKNNYAVKVRIIMLPKNKHSPS